MEIRSPITALGLGCFINLAPTNGTAPYSYALKANGAGGTLVIPEDGFSVTYTAPSNLPASGVCVDTIQVTDAQEATAEVSLIVGDYLTIICDILAHEMDMAGRVFLYNQKFMKPTDEKPYIVVSVQHTRPRGNNVQCAMINGVYCSIASVPSAAIVGIDIISRSLAALERKDEIPVALASVYSQQQQSRCGFQLAKSIVMQNLSDLDGDAMLYHFHGDVTAFYGKTYIKPVDYFDGYEIETKINA